MATTKASKAAAKAGQPSVRASGAKRRAAPAKAPLKGRAGGAAKGPIAKGPKGPAEAKTKRGRAGPRSEAGQSARSRLVELKRRIREMANLSAGPDRDVVKTAPKAKPAGAAAGTRSAGAALAQSRLAELKRRLQEASDIADAGAVLSWDQATYMPKGGAGARARQGATLSRLAHERLTDPALGKLLDGLMTYAEGLPEDSDDACLIRVVRREHDKAVRVPAELVARRSEAASASYDAWTRARPANDFATMRPFLERMLDLSREYAGHLGPYDHIADPLIDDLDDGMTVASVRALFDQLRAELVPIVQAIAGQPVADDSCLRKFFPETRQLDFSVAVIRRFGYDFDRGRLDKTHHPFCTRFAAGDVRITTRVKENDLGDALFSTLHEAGHALYEQGVNPAYEGTRLDCGTSMGVHESQSRLWENLVGRSLGFWQHFYPCLRQVFPEQLDAVSLETFYRAINKVERSLIRTDADEVTYNLHVMLRFGLELDLLEGRLKVKDLPDAWRARFKADLGLEPPDDRDGCLQDVHWYAGGIGGAFQSYTIGNILSAQFYTAAVAAHPGIPREIERGGFGTLHAWLRDHLYRHGRKFRPDEIVRRATGQPMTIEPYIGYLRGRYGELYRLPPRAGRVKAKAGVAAPTR
jgi:carboxypeptidase Taq